MIDSANVIRQAYRRKVPGAAWPMTARRLDSIYGTVQRVLRSPGDRRPLLERLLATASEWGTRCSVVLQDQATFNAWLFQQFESLMDVPFAWKQAPRDGQDVAHRHLSFGATQKFLNLVLKDWWARSGQATELAPLCHSSAGRVPCLTAFPALWSTTWIGHATPASSAQLTSSVMIFMSFSSVPIGQSESRLSNFCGAGSVDPRSPV